MNLTLRILYLTQSNEKINFIDYKFNQKLYITIENLSTIKQVELIKKKKFVVFAFDPNNKIFVVYIIFLISFYLNVHLSCKALRALLIQDKTSTMTLSKDTYFIDRFYLDFASEFLEYTRINNHCINLVKSWQLFYRPIYTLKPI